MATRCCQDSETRRDPNRSIEEPKRNTYVVVSRTWSFRNRSHCGHVIVLRVISTVCAQHLVCPTSLARGDRFRLAALFAVGHRSGGLSSTGMFHYFFRDTDRLPDVHFELHEESFLFRLDSLMRTRFQTRFRHVSALDVVVSPTYLFSYRRGARRQHDTHTARHEETRRLRQSRAVASQCQFTPGRLGLTGTRLVLDGRRSPVSNHKL